MAIPTQHALGGSFRAGESLASDVCSNIGVRDLISRAEKLRSEAFTANREHMEHLLPRMEEVMEDIEEEEARLNAQRRGKRIGFSGSKSASVNYQEQGTVRTKTKYRGFSSMRNVRASLGFKKTKTKRRKQKPKAANLDSTAHTTQSVKTSGGSVAASGNERVSISYQRPKPSRGESATMRFSTTSLPSIIPEDLNLNSNDRDGETAKITRQLSQGSAANRSRSQIAPSSLNRNHTNQFRARGSYSSYHNYKSKTEHTRHTKLTHASITSGKSEPVKRSLKNLLSEKKLFEEALESVRSRAVVSERRVLRQGSVCGVYNPSTGRIEWKERENAGVYGVYHPTQERVIWKEKPNYSICGVYNPEKGNIEWKEIFSGTVSGVYNPITKKVEWQEHRLGGVAGVFNPQTQKVEWRYNKRGGIIGWYEPSPVYKKRVGNSGFIQANPLDNSFMSLDEDYSEDQTRHPYHASDQSNDPQEMESGGKIKWEKADGAGICRVTRDYENGGYVTSCCNVTKWRR